MEVATEHSEGQGLGARQRVEEGLLLHRIDLQAADVAVGHAQCPALVEPDLADAGVPRWDQAAVPARHAADALLREALTQLTLTRPAAEKLPKGRVLGEQAGLNP